MSVDVACYNNIKALHMFCLWQERGPYFCKLPHLIVQIHEVPLEVMGEKVVLTSAAERRE